MNLITSVSVDDVIQQIISSPLPDNIKREFLEIVDGKRIASLMNDIMAKHLFSPDTHPERFDFIMQRIMNDPSIKSAGSAANELPVEFLNSKRTISDITSWLTDGRLASLEFQSAVQEYSFNRFDIYSSRMLLLCYSSDRTGKKGDIDYSNAREVLLVILMLKSPSFLKNSASHRYIHHFTDAISDTGIRMCAVR